jgi:hypothetical protein
MTTPGSKRKLGEVTKPAFVAREQDGAYNIVEMPKRYMLGYMADKEFVNDKIMSVFQRVDSETTAMSIRVLIHSKKFIREMKAQDAARRAAAGHDPSSI